MIQRRATCSGTDLITLQDASNRANRSELALLNICHRAQIPKFTISGKVHISWKALNKFLSG